MSNKNLTIGMVVAIILAVIGIFTPAGKEVVKQVSQFGSADFVTNYDAIELTKGFLVTNASTTLIGKLQNGSSGTALKNRVEGLCYIFPYSASMTGSSTALVDCQANSSAGTAGAITALTGVQANDFVQVLLSTTTAQTTYPGLVVIGASASTTNGFITLRIRNDGAAFTWPITGTASGTAYFISSRP